MKFSSLFSPHPLARAAQRAAYSEHIKRFSSLTAAQHNTVQWRECSKHANGLWYAWQTRKRQLTVEQYRFIFRSQYRAIQRAVRCLPLDERVVREYLEKTRCYYRQYSWLLKYYAKSLVEGPVVERKTRDGSWVVRDLNNYVTVLMDLINLTKGQIIILESAAYDMDLYALNEVLRLGYGSIAPRSGNPEWLNMFLKSQALMDFWPLTKKKDVSQGIPDKELANQMRNLQQLLQFIKQKYKINVPLINSNPPPLVRLLGQPLSEAQLRRKKMKAMNKAKTTVSDHRPWQQEWLNHVEQLASGLKPIDGLLDDSRNLRRLKKQSERGSTRFCGLGADIRDRKSKIYKLWTRVVQRRYQALLDQNYAIVPDSEGEKGKLKFKNPIPKANKIMKGEEWMFS